MVHETELKPKRKRSQPVTNVSEGKRDEPQKSNQAVEPDRATARPLKIDGTVTPAEPRPVKPELEALDDLARDFVEIENLFDRTESTSESDRPRDPYPTIPRDHADSAPDFGTIYPEFPRFIEPDQPLEHPSDSSNELTERVDGISREPIEPDSAGKPETSDPIVSHSETSEWETIEPENLSGNVSAHRFNPDDHHRSDYGNDLELAADPDLGADQWESEQPGDQSKEDAQVIEIYLGQQKILNLFNTWSDKDLLRFELAVKRYFEQAPPESDLEKGQRDADRETELETHQIELTQQLSAQQQRLERLRPQRSFLHPFGSSPREVKEAELEVSLTQTKLQKTSQEIQLVKQSFMTWQKPLKFYRDWLRSEKTKTMREAQNILKMSEVQERLVLAQRAQTRGKALKELLKWEEMAVQLGKPQTYVARVQEVTAGYQKYDIRLSKKAIECWKQDRAAYYHKVQQQQMTMKRRSHG